MFKKFRKISRLTERRSVYYLCILFVSAIFFAVITFTPFSNIISSVLKNDFNSTFTNDTFVKGDKNKFDLQVKINEFSFSHYKDKWYIYDFYKD